MKNIKLFEEHLNESSEQFTLILHNWNPYIVPSNELKNRPDEKDFLGNGTTDQWTKQVFDADKRWIAKIEHYYVTPELQNAWDWKTGYGSKTKDVKKVFKGIDFDIEKQDTIEHAKIAHGAPTVELKNTLVAVPVKEEDKSKYYPLITNEMKKFGEFEKTIGINESEVYKLNEQDSELTKLGEDILVHLEDNKIKADLKQNPDNSIDITVGGETYHIKRDAPTGFDDTTQPKRFVLSTKHNKEEILSADELISWWASYVPQHNADKAEYQKESTNENI